MAHEEKGLKVKKILFKYIINQQLCTKYFKAMLHFTLELNWSAIYTYMDNAMLYNYVENI